MKKTLLVSFYLFLLLGIIFNFSACKISKKIAVVQSGNANISAIKVDKQKISGLTDNETFAYYKKDGVRNIKPVNEIEFQLIKKYNAKKGVDNNIDLQSNKDKYAYINVNKYFYKYNFGLEILRYLYFAPSLGSSLAMFRPRQFKMISSEICKENDLCKGNTYEKRILIESRIWCKNDKIQDTVTIVENLPNEIKVLDYKIKIKRGKSRITNVLREEKSDGGEKYIVYKIIGVNGEIQKKNKVWILLDVAITPSDRNYLQ